MRDNLRMNIESFSVVAPLGNYINGAMKQERSKNLTLRKIHCRISS